MIGILLVCGLAPAGDRTLVGQLDREVIALQQKVVRLEAAVSTCSTETQPDPLFVELKSVLVGLPAQVTRQGGRVAVTVALDTLFVPDSRTLREEAVPLLDLLSTALKLHPSVSVTVIAHHDTGAIPVAFQKAFGTAWEFSAWRAALVVHALSARFGVLPAQLTAAGRGDQDPVSSNDTPEGRYLNRRLVLILDPRASQ